MRKKTANAMPECRSNCPISFALDVVGDRWTLIVLRDLMLSHKRYFQEFLDSNEKIASNILASRLKLLESAGLVTRAADPAHARRVIYTPTAKALDLLPAILELLLWGQKHHAKANAPTEFVRRAAEDRAGLIAELRAPHSL